MKANVFVPLLALETQNNRSEVSQLRADHSAALKEMEARTRTSLNDEHVKKFNAVSRHWSPYIDLALTVSSSVFGTGIQEA